MSVVVTTAEFDTWVAGLAAAEQATVVNVVTKLQVLGVALGFPHSSAVEGATESLRELRPKGGRSPLRVFYAFDPRRQAVLLIGGDKSGDPKFYRRMIPIAERIWTEYLAP
jgi:hypothetical protein